MNEPGNNNIRLPLAPGRSLAVAVLHEDEALLALDKPSGLSVSPDTYNREKPNLMSALRRALDTNAEWVCARRITYLANAHRLDADTSGVLLLAKTREALRGLARQFNDRSVRKSYLALVEGEPQEDQFSVEMKLGPHPARPWLHVERRHDGRWTLTRFRVVERFRFPWLRRAAVAGAPCLTCCALLECAPETGRTHQIRAHLARASHPILCDKLYGHGDHSALYLSQLKARYKHHAGAAERPLLGRLALHAQRIAFDHPLTGRRLELESPLPNDFAVALKYLRKFARV
ncbi:MAG: pseudouridine synthase [Verrucomicrobiae bacterium]|nr:pseudouridine synthase [Verrucomicrobiae bacterium]